MAPMGVTVPSGVTTISAPPVRKIQPEIVSQMPQPPQPSLLGVYPGTNPVSSNQSVKNIISTQMLRLPVSQLSIHMNFGVLIDIPTNGGRNT